MTLSETYSLGTGASKIKSPYIFCKYYPINSNKYITLHPSSQVGAKSYDLWREVIEILYPILSKEKIDIVQIGQQNDPQFHGCIRTSGTTSIGQAAYIIKGTLLSLGVDSFSAHFASAFDKKIVALYSSTYANIAKPYWGNPNDQILLEPDRKGKKPSFANEEQPKTINSISPEKIAGAVCKLLNLDFNFPYKTIHTGNRFNSNVIFETVPNQAIQLQSLGVDSILVRMDYLFNENALIQQLQFGNVSIVTDKPINIEILKQFRPRIKELIYFIDENHSLEFVIEAKKLGLNLILISELAPEKLNPIKLHYMDIGVINQKPKIIKENIEILKDKDISNLYYQSNKFTLSAGKIYQSKAAWLQNSNLNGLKFEFQPIIDNSEFWNESESFWLTEK